MKYTPIKIKSEFSFLNSCVKVKPLVKKLKELNIDSAAICDNNLFASYDFSNYSHEININPILSQEIKLKHNDKIGHISLYVKNKEGFENLSELSFLESKNGFIELSDLSGRGGLILTTGGNKSLLNKMIEEKDPNHIYLVNEFNKLFPVDSLFIEIQRPYENEETENTLLSIAFSKKIALVGTNVVKYLTSEEDQYYKILESLEKKESLSISRKDDDTPYVSDLNDDGKRFKLYSDEEFSKIFIDIPEAIENTNYIASSCNFLIEKRKETFPKFGDDENLLLSEKTWQGFEEKLKTSHFFENVSKETIELYRERIQYELKIIEQMGFPGYFLIVSDFIQWAKSKNVPVGPGRGSGAGSLVAWVLKITDINPIPYGLLFERFLNPERVSMPDFDIDFCEIKKEQVIEYIREKYGNDKVAKIATFSEIKSKNAIKDTGRFLVDEKYGVFNFSELNEITGLIRDTPADPKNLEEAYSEFLEFSNFIESNPKNKILFDLSKGIEGLKRHYSIHAAGIVIGDEKLNKILPTVYSHSDQSILTAYDMKNTEKRGLVKFDFLSLTTLTVIDAAIQKIKENHNIDIDLLSIKLDDQKVLDFFRDGNTYGVFQFETDIFKNVLRKIRPDSFEELALINAINRPGPKDYIDEYVARKNGVKEFKYPEPQEITSKFLKETQGIMIYQEQVMLIAQHCAGYSLGGADIMRRAMGKKIKEEMAKQREIFIAGCVKNNIDADKAEELFNDIDKFANYGFNKSHAIAYAFLAYQTMWLKTYYPLEYYLALFNTSYSNDKKLSDIKNDIDFNRERIIDLGVEDKEYKKWFINLMKPDINKSYGYFSIEGNNIRYGVYGLKEISYSDKWEELFKKRDELPNGKFESIHQFVEMSSSFISKDQYLILCQSGFFDSINSNRYQNSILIDFLIQGNKKKQKGTKDLFEEDGKLEYPKDDKYLVDDWSDREKRQFESAGFYIEDHPIGKYHDIFKETKKVKRVEKIFEYMKNRNVDSIKNQKIAVMIESIVVRETKNKKQYLEIFVSERYRKHRIAYYSNYNNMNIDEFQSLLNKYKIDQTPVVFDINLKLSEDKTMVWVNVNSVEDLQNFLISHANKVIIKVDTEKKKNFFRGQDQETIINNITDKIKTILDETKNNNGKLLSYCIDFNGVIYDIGQYPLLTDSQKPKLKMLPGVLDMTSVFDPYKKNENTLNYEILPQ